MILCAMNVVCQLWIMTSVIWSDISNFIWISYKDNVTTEGIRLCKTLNSLAFTISKPVWS